MSMLQRCACECAESRLSSGDENVERIRTRLADHFNADNEQLFKQRLNRILQGRPQTAEEIASAALFLVSDQSSAITGQTLNVDGGTAFY